MAVVPALEVSHLLAPRAAPGICPACFNPMRPGEDRCRACRQNEQHLDAFVPISYCLARSRLHAELADYKRAADPSVPLVTTMLAAILGRFLVLHERCLSAAAGRRDGSGHDDRAPAGSGRGFDLVTTVPSNHPGRDECHPLRRLVGEHCEPTRDRYRRVLRRSPTPLPPRSFDRRRFVVTERIDGQTVLLIDDTWTTGASAQSAAAALREAGATKVAAAVIGRYVNGDWCQAGRRLRAQATPFTFDECALCTPPRMP